MPKLKTMTMPDLPDFLARNGSPTKTKPTLTLVNSKVKARALPQAPARVPLQAPGKATSKGKGKAPAPTTPKAPAAPQAPAKAPEQAPAPVPATQVARRKVLPKFNAGDLVQVRNPVTGNWGGRYAIQALEAGETTPPGDDWYAVDDFTLVNAVDLRPYPVPVVAKPAPAPAKVQAPPAPAGKDPTDQLELIAKVLGVDPKLLAASLAAHGKPPAPAPAGSPAKSKGKALASTAKSPAVKSAPAPAPAGSPSTAVYAAGNTYPHRQALKEMGGVWDKATQIWRLPEVQVKNRTMKQLGAIWYPDKNLWHFPK